MAKNPDPEPIEICQHLAEFIDLDRPTIDFHALKGMAADGNELWVCTRCYEKKYRAKVLKMHEAA